MEWVKAKIVRRGEGIQKISSILPLKEILIVHLIFYPINHSLTLFSCHCSKHWQAILVMSILIKIMAASTCKAVLNSNFACGNRRTHVILLQIGPQQSLLMIVK